MAKLSKRARYHAQTKRENTLLRQQALRIDQERIKSTSLALLLLAKAGGDVTLEKAFLDNVQGQIAFMGYEHRVQENGDLSIKVVVNEAAMAEALAAMEAAKLEAGVDVAAPKSEIVLTDAPEVV